jgi:hypothetical protein
LKGFFLISTKKPNTNAEGIPLGEPNKNPNQNLKITEGLRLFFIGAFDLFVSCFLSFGSYQRQQEPNKNPNQNLKITEGLRLFIGAFDLFASCFLSFGS